MIEQELGIALPESYKRAVVPFRIPALAGNKDYALWDDAHQLVQFNRQLRAGSRTRPAWPPHLFAVGNPHGDELIALDTRSPEGPVWWLDHGVVDSKSSYQSHAQFSVWVEEFYRETRSELAGDGMDPDGKPGLPKSRLGTELLSLVAAAVVVVIIMFGIAWLRSWFHRSS
jgi:hypothetical protein